MKIVFMGTPEFARSPLVCLDQSRHELLAVVTGPDQRSGRGRKVLPCECKAEAQSRQIMTFTPNTLKSDELYDSLAELKPDLFVVVAFRILPKRLFSLPKFGSINIHASLLPKYRGAAPINWALINGEIETGLTSFFLKRRVDAGEIIHQQRFPIEERDNFDSLSQKLSEGCGEFLLESLDLIEGGNVQPIAQDEALVSPAPKLNPEDGLIEFSRPAVQVANQVRGMTSRPGTYCFFRGKKIKITEAAAAQIEGEDGPPGTLLINRKRLLVQCSDSVLELTKLVPEGRKEMDGRSFINGFRLCQGDTFTQKI